MNPGRTDGHNNELLRPTKRIPWGSPRPGYGELSKTDVLWGRKHGSSQQEPPKGTRRSHLGIPGTARLRWFVRTFPLAGAKGSGFISSNAE